MHRETSIYNNFGFPTHCLLFMANLKIVHPLLFSTIIHSYLYLIIYLTRCCHTIKTINREPYTTLTDNYGCVPVLTHVIQGRIQDLKKGGSILGLQAKNGDPGGGPILGPMLKSLHKGGGGPPGPPRIRQCDTSDQVLCEIMFQFSQPEGLSEVNHAVYGNLRNWTLNS